MHGRTLFGSSVLAKENFLIQNKIDVANQCTVFFHELNENVKQTYGENKSQRFFLIFNSIIKSKIFCNINWL